MMQFSIAAPAKLNLCLHITGRRADGYHLLESLVVCTELADTIDIAPASTLTLSIQGEFAEFLQDFTDHNLVIKAASLLRLQSGCNAGAAITLTKRIPVGAGLGGGSSDAASCLLALNQFWNLRCDPGMLHRIAVQLGSDVPACMARSAVWMRGIGELVTPVVLAFPMWVVLVNPGSPLPTKDVYHGFKSAFTTPRNMPTSFSTIQDLLALLGTTKNALEPSAIQQVPAIQHVLASIQETPRCLFARMTGSGATCFGLYANQSDAATARRMLQQRYPEWWCVDTGIKDMTL